MSDWLQDLIGQDEEVPYGDIVMGKLTAMHWRHIGRAEGRNDLRKEIRQAYREDLGAAVGVTVHNTEPQDAEVNAQVDAAIARGEPPF